MLFYNSILFVKSMHLMKKNYLAKYYFYMLVLSLLALKNFFLS